MKVPDFFNLTLSVRLPCDCQWVDPDKIEKTDTKKKEAFYIFLKILSTVKIILDCTVLSLLCVQVKILLSKQW